MYFTKLRNNAKILYFGFFLIFFGLFVLTYHIRQEIITDFTNRTFFWGINYLAYIGLFIFILYGCINIKKDFPFLIILSVAALLVLFTTIITNRSSIGWAIMYMSCCVFSICFVFVKLPEKHRGRLLRYFMIVYNIMVVLMFIWGGIDHLFGKPIAKWVATFMTYSPYYKGFAYNTDTENIRFYSFLGNPLLNSTIFNSFFALNSLYNEHHKPVFPTLLCCLITLFSATFCGSKTGICVTLIISLIVFFRNYKTLILLGVTFLGILFSGLADNLIIRFLTKPLTTGRAAALSALLKDPEYPFHFLYGYGNFTAPGYGPAFEFPLVTFSFEYGILYAVLLLGCTFLYVTLKLFHKKSIRFWLIWLFLFAQVNTYNCLVWDMDYSLIFYFTTMVFLNIFYDYPQENEKLQT